MCGILFYEGDDTINFDEYFEQIRVRGPDNKSVIKYENKLFGFHRLSINGLDAISNQPFYMSDCILIANAEIFNWKDLLNQNPDFEYKSSSDCEIIIHMYRKYGMDYTIKNLDGEFAFVLYDIENDDLFIGRDHLGIRGLFIGKKENELMVGSEMKCIKEDLEVKQFPPGHYYCNGNYIKYIDNDYQIIPRDKNTVKMELKELFTNAVKKRLMSDRPISCLLSGGLDSTLVCSIVRKVYDKPLNTYSIGIKGATDLEYAKIASEYLNTNHTSIELDEMDFLNAIKETIFVIESYDTTTVRASVGNYLVSKYIKENSKDTVLFCGDVSDEIFGSYRGFTKAPSKEDFLNENKKMLQNIHYFDVLRSDRSISNASLEARVPFSDKKFVDYVMTLDPEYKMFNKDKMEKLILREAFEGYLPDNLLYRRKEAFSDGVSSINRSWHTIIKEFCDQKYSDEVYQHKIKKYSINTPYDKESLYYREIFELFYPNRAHVIPYFWKHPFCDVQDPSARDLDCY